MAIVDGEQIYHNNFNAIAEGIKGNGVIWGCAVKENSPTGMSVLVEVGEYLANWTRNYIDAETEVTITAADAVKPRKDLIVGDAVGNLTAVAGTPEAAQPTGKEGIYAQYPMPPDIPANKTLFGEGWVEEEVEEILDVDITDRRVMLRGNRMAFCFYQDNVTASQTDVALNVLGQAGNAAYYMPHYGSITAISVRSNDARTAGTLTVDATIAGTKTGLQAVLDGTNTSYHSAAQAQGTDRFSAGSDIGVKITTDAGWLPETADIVVVIIVEVL